MTTFKAIDEQDYINISDLTKIRMARQILSDIMPQNSVIIDIGDFQAVLSTLSMWEKDHYDKVIVK